MSSSNHRGTYFFIDPNGYDRQRGIATILNYSNLRIIANSSSPSSSPIRPTVNSGRRRRRAIGNGGSLNLRSATNLLILFCLICDAAAKPIAVNSKLNRLKRNENHQSELTNRDYRTGGEIGSSRRSMENGENEEPSSSQGEPNRTNDESYANFFDAINNGADISASNEQKLKHLLKTTENMQTFQKQLNQQVLNNGGEPTSSGELQSSYDGSAAGSSSSSLTVSATVVSSPSSESRNGGASRTLTDAGGGYNSGSSGGGRRKNATNHQQHKVRHHKHSSHHRKRPTHHTHNLNSWGSAVNVADTDGGGNIDRSDSYVQAIDTTTNQQNIRRFKETSAVNQAVSSSPYECPKINGKVTQLLCPSRRRHGYHVCVDETALCNGHNECPNGEDENPVNCMFYKTTMRYFKTVVDQVVELSEHVLENSRRRSREDEL